MLMSQNALLVVARLPIPGLVYALLVNEEGFSRTLILSEKSLRTSIPLLMDMFPT